MINLNIIYICNENLSIKSFCSIVNPTLVLYHLQIAGVLSQTCHHSHSAPPPKHPNIHLSNHTIHIYIKQSWRHHTALSRSNINRKPLAHKITHSQKHNQIIYKYNGQHMNQRPRQRVICKNDSFE